MIIYWEGRVGLICNWLFLWYVFPSPWAVLRPGPGLTPLRLETTEEGPPLPYQTTKRQHGRFLAPPPLGGQCWCPGFRPAQVAYHLEVSLSQRAGTSFQRPRLLWGSLGSFKRPHTFHSPKGSILPSFLLAWHTPSSQRRLSIKRVAARAHMFSWAPQPQVPPTWLFPSSAPPLGVSPATLCPYLRAHSDRAPASREGIRAHS